MSEKKYKTPEYCCNLLLLLTDGTEPRFPAQQASALSIAYRSHGTMKVIADTFDSLIKATCASAR